jgi:predicted ATPase/class 3 adenylate cyclase/DNA-binding winged helix-turn-helix (wHTH) protein
MDAEDPPCRVYRFDRFTLDLARGALLTSDGAELPLRPKSFALLQFLVENAGRLLDRDTIMQAVWPDVFVTDDSITQCVRDIRRALGDEVQRLLRTVPRRGYRFIAEVSCVGPAGAVSDESSRLLTRQPAVLLAPSAHLEDEPRRAELGDVPEDLAGDSRPDGALGSGHHLPHQSLLSELDTERTSSRPTPVPEQDGPVGPSLSPGPERRQLTLLFCDLIGSAALSEQMDPEDFGSVIRIYLEHCAAAITRCGGHVANYIGDGVLAYFGYPYAREDAAERAVRAGLAVVQATSDLKPDPDLALQLRAGIATGLVVNDQVGGSAQGQVMVGKPLNLATRLAAIAEPGTVVIADSTRRLVGELFALEELDNRPLKGFTAPVQAWRVTGEGTAESPFQALRGARLTPLVGRGQELSLLLDRWEQAQEGEGQVVLLAGEPGIGKSRLVQAVRDRLADEPHIHAGYYCSSHRRDSPLRPVIAQLERAANFSRGDDHGQKLAKLEVLLARGSEDVARVAPLIASLLSIPSGGRYPPRAMSPQLQRERILAALVDQLAGLAAHLPVLLVWEDAHWADPTSLELLGLAIDRLQSLPVLALVTFRPEFAPPWPGHTHVTSLTLNRLGRRRCARLVAGLTGGRLLPMEILDQIMARAEGVPLFVEELTKAVLESGLLREEDDCYEVEGPMPPVAVPATLQDSLMARLDRLAPVKEIAQVAAVIGREFSHELLAAIVSRGKEELTEALRQLIAVELVFRRGTLPETTYVFKHALVRDAAYASLLKGRRQQLHARIAQVLEERFPRVVEAEPDVLARHWTEAGEAETAAVYRLKAGERALAHSATAEAVAQLTMGQEILQSLPDGAERQRRELDLQIALGTALAAAQGLAAPGTARAYARARELSGELGEERRLVPVLLGLWASHNARDELGAARVVAAQLLELAEQRRDGAAGILGHRALGATLFGLGEFAAARTHLQQLLTLDRSAGHSLASLPYDPCVSGRAWLALTLAVLGYPDQAVVQSDEALAEAVRLRHHNTTSVVLSLRCSLGQFLRDPHDVATHSEALVAVAVEQDFAYWSGLGMYFRGWARAKAGELMAGIEEMQRALAVCQTTGAQAYVPYNLALLADTCRRAGDVPQGRKLLDEALDGLGRTDARYCEAELLRIDGELQLARSRPNRDGAEASFGRAIEVAHRQDAKAAELRAAMSLARSWADCGKRRRAYDLLAPIYGWFTEGFDTSDLKEAKVLFAELA